MVMYSKLIPDLTLALLYLTSWKEGARGGDGVHSWKGYDFDILNEFDERGLAIGSKNSKSVLLTEDGVARAQAILKGLEDGSLESLKELNPDRDGGSIEPTSRKAFRLAMTLKEVEPRCLRTVCVPADYSFLDLHIITQALFGWLDSHLYDFSFLDKGGERRFVCESFNGMHPYSEYEGSLSAEDTPLNEIFSFRKQIIYSYDYGDGWQVTIERRKVLDDYSSADPCFCGGEGAAPPEDVGGPGGFDDFLKIIKDENHPEYEEMLEWGYMQGFEHFSDDYICQQLVDWREDKKMHLEFHEGR